MEKTQELLKFLAELVDLQGVISDNLFGPHMGANTGENRCEEPSIDSMIRGASATVACLVGEAKTILAKLCRK